MKQIKICKAPFQTMDHLHTPTIASNRTRRRLETMEWEMGLCTSTKGSSKNRIKNRQVSEVNYVNSDIKISSIFCSIKCWPNKHCDLTYNSIWNVASAISGSLQRLLIDHHQVRYIETLYLHRNFLGMILPGWQF